MTRRTLAKYTKAFTLTELMIALTLFAVVVSLVVSFILYMSDFNRDNQKAVARAKEQSMLRQELDFWFSALDREEYTVHIASSVSTLRDGEWIVWATEEGKDIRFGISRLFDEETGITAFTFRYPSYLSGTDSVLERRVECEYVSAVYLSQYGGVESLDSLKAGEHALNFSIRTVVKPAVYLCDIIYS